MGSVTAPTFHGSCVWVQTEARALPLSQASRGCLREQEWPGHLGSLASALLGVLLGGEQRLSQFGCVGCLWADYQAHPRLLGGSLVPYGGG